MGESHIAWRINRMQEKRERDLLMIEEYKNLLSEGVSSMNAKKHLARKFKLHHENSVTYILWQFGANKYRSFTKYKTPEIAELNLDDIFLTGMEKAGGKFKMENFGFNYEKLKDRCFVYFLKNENELVYVGVTENIFSRLCCHKADKQFSEVILLEYNSRDLAGEMENLYIKLYNPILNKLIKKFNIKKINI